MEYTLTASTTVTQTAVFLTSVSISAPTPTPTPTSALTYTPTDSPITMASLSTSLSPGTFHDTTTSLSRPNSTATQIIQKSSAQIPARVPELTIVFIAIGCAAGVLVFGSLVTRYLLRRRRSIPSPKRINSNEVSIAGRIAESVAHE